MQAIKAIPPWTGYNQPDLANQSTTRTSPKLVVNYSVSVMKAPVSLKAVVDEIDGLSDDHVAYLNLQTGELVTLSAEEISAVEEDIAVADFPEWQQALITKARDLLASDDYLQLPTQRDFHEYAIMERFCSAIVDKHLRNILFDQIRECYENTLQEGKIYRDTMRPPSFKHHTSTLGASASLIVATACCLRVTLPPL